MEKIEFKDPTEINGPLVDERLKKYVPHFKKYLNKRRPIYEAILALSVEDLNFFTQKEGSETHSNAAACAVFLTLVIESHPGTTAKLKNECEGYDDELHMLSSAFISLCSYAGNEKKLLMKCEVKGKKLSKIQGAKISLNPMFLKLCEAKGVDLDSEEGVYNGMAEIFESCREWDEGRDGQKPSQKA